MTGNLMRKSLRSISIKNEDRKTQLAIYEELELDFILNIETKYHWTLSLEKDQLTIETNWVANTVNINKATPPYVGSPNNSISIKYTLEIRNKLILAGVSENQLVRIEKNGQ